MKLLTQKFCELSDRRYFSYVTFLASPSAVSVTAVLRIIQTKAW